MTAKDPPGDLGGAGRDLWCSILAAYVLSPAELAVLERAARCADRLAEIDLVTTTSLPLVPGSVGQLRPNPAYLLASETEKVFDGLIRSLNLPLPDEDEGVRRNPQQRAAAQARWRSQREERQANG